MEYMEWNGMERTCDFPWNSMESVILNSIKIWTFSSIIYWNRMLKFQYPDVIYPWLKNKLVVWNLLNFRWKIVKNKWNMCKKIRATRDLNGISIFYIPLVF
jgi:hypothetical protein